MKALDVCKEIHCCMQADGDAHAAVQDSTKHVNMQVEPRLQPK